MLYFEKIVSFKYEKRKHLWNWVQKQYEQKEVEKEKKVKVIVKKLFKNLIIKVLVFY